MSRKLFLIRPVVPHVIRDVKQVLQTMIDLLKILGDPLSQRNMILMIKQMVDLLKDARWPPLRPGFNVFRDVKEILPSMVNLLKDTGWPPLLRHLFSLFLLASFPFGRRFRLCYFLRLWEWNALIFTRTIRKNSK